MSASPEPHSPDAPLVAVNSRRHRMLWGVTISLLVITLVVFLLWLFYFRFHETTEDAYLNGNLVNINSVIPGSVIAFYADDTQLVQEGQLLVELDRTEYQVQYEQELNALASVVLQVRQLYDTVKGNEVLVAKKRIDLQRAQFDFNNRARLIAAQAVSNEEYEHAREALLAAELEVQQTEYQLHVSHDAAGNTNPESHPLIEQQKAKVKKAYYNLHHCSIYAPTRGFIAQRTVDVGESVVPNIPLMAVVPLDYVWVDANYKETQLRYMRIGQPATVTLDIYGSGAKYKGHVIGIGFGTGSVFSLIPPQNATGNWIKIVQRLPVRISLDRETLEKFPPRLGLSAEVDVDITDRSLPLLATTTSSQPIGKTGVFDMDFSAVDQLMDKILQENMHKPHLHKQAQDRE